MTALLVASCVRLFWRPWLVLLWAVVLAAFFALISLLTRNIGFKWAPLPFMLGALGAATFSVVVLELFNTIAEEEHLAMDPARVIEGIVGGIGFLGAGAIIQARGSVVGATTGASIWVVGGIGMACGFGFYLHAMMAAGIAVAVLTGLGWIVNRLSGGERPEE